MIRQIILALTWVFASVSGGQAQTALNLRDADLRSFVEIVSQQTGRNFIVDPRVQGTVTVFAPSNVSDLAVYEIFLDVLELNRLTIVPGGEADRIVPLDTARELSGSPPRLGGSYETRVIELQTIDPASAAEIIRPLIPAEAVLSVLPSAGVLVLSDRRENQEKVANLLARLDGPRQDSIETIRLRDGNAADMLSTLEALQITPPGASLSADDRSNSIVVSGNAEFRDRVRRVVGQLDTPQRSLQTTVVRLNYADARTIEAVVSRSFGAAIAQSGEGGATAVSEVAIVADTGSNALVVTAPSDRIDAIVASIHALDNRPAQVLVEAVIFELSVENFSDLSVQFGGILNGMVAGGVEFNLRGRPTLSSVVSAAATGGAPPGIGAGGTIGGGYSRNEDAFVGFLSALASQTSTRLLSTPSIMTLNNTQAEIIVAQNVPFVTGSYSKIGDSAVPDSPFQTIERQDVGLSLKVTPQITSEDTIRLAIQQEVSSLTNTASAAGGEITNKRTLATNVLVGNGRVIMLGGLLENGSGAVDQRVPGLSELPLVGGLFRGRNVNSAQKVLLVLMRPRIVASDSEAEVLSREVASDARRASLALRPKADRQFPARYDTALPFDGVDLTQPFGFHTLDTVAQKRNFPPLPAPLTFD